jgi:hypothetical protein
VFLHIRAAPNETVEKVRFCHFRRKVPLENKGVLGTDFSILGFFDSLNKGMQATVDSVRCAPAARRA